MKIAKRNKSRDGKNNKHIICSDFNMLQMVTFIKTKNWLLKVDDIISRKPDFN
jgi:hypothetical protein